MNGYWETYSDQTIEEGFTHIGVGSDIQEIIDIDSDVAELQRRYGKLCDIRVYKKELVNDAV